MKQIKGGVTAPQGFMAAAAEAGIKYKNRTDMANKLGSYQLFALVNSMNCEEKIVEFDVDNDQLYLARVPKEIEPANIYEVKIKNYIR